VLNECTDDEGYNINGNLSLFDNFIMGSNVEHQKGVVVSEI